MDANEPTGYDYNHYAGSNTLSLRYTDVSGSRLTEPLGLGHTALHHSETQFDSSTDETVIPYMLGDQASREFVSATSIERFDLEESPKSFLSRRTRHSIDTEQCGTLYEESVNVELDPLVAGYQGRMSEMDDIPAQIEGQETQRLMGDALMTQHAEKTTGDKLGRQHRPRRGWCTVLLASSYGFA